MIYITNKDGLIGDFLGSIPAIQALSEKNNLVVEIHPEAEKLTSLVHDPYNRILWTTKPSGGHISHTLYSATAFPIATTKELYMSQAYFEQVGLLVPLSPPKARLTYDNVDVPIFDYIISPFARSLPPEQKLSREVWQALVDSMPDKKFCVIGSKTDQSDYILAMNTWVELGSNFTYVCNLLTKSTKGLISVVTGTSHLAFHLGVRNWILNNQDFAWGTNPDGLCLRKNIPDITAGDIKKHLED